MKLIASVLRLFLIVGLVASAALADGVMRPSDVQYPKNFLRHRMTKVDVTLYGQIAVTKVYQEFVNEWTQKTNAVYSFPLPADARATDFFFWSNDTIYQAVLKVKEQAVNPGTGEGGIDAQLSAYLGKNAIRILLNDVPAGGIQRTQLEYISLCSYDNGRIRYTFPFNTQAFVTTPIESYSVAVHINAADDILSGAVNSDTSVPTIKTDARHWDMTYDRSKVYPTSDLTVDYRTASADLNVETYGVSNDTLDGHFVMIVKPQTTLDSSTILRKNAVFLIDCSISTQGVAFTASIGAVKQCLASLRTGDVFDIVTFNSSATAWKPQPVAATSANIAAATAYLSGLVCGGGSNLSSGLTTALNMVANDSLNNAIMMFSDGQSAADPKTIAALNTHKAGIFPIAMGDNVNRQRLEMIAYQNYGFPTYLAVSDPLVDLILKVFSKINYPVLKDVRMEFGSNVYGILPQTLQTVYSGSRFYLTGRFKKAGVSGLSIAGTSLGGPKFMNFLLNFPAEKTVNKFAERFWAKEQLDAIERQIAVYGATDSLKQLAIKISLTYNIRCQYTAYLADKTKPVTSVVSESEPTIEHVTLLRSADVVTLAWEITGKAEVAECNIYRGDSPSGTFVRLNATSVGGSSFSDRDAAPGRVYYYRIEIVTRSGKRITSAVYSSLGTRHADAYALAQNYPNPFNPATSIQFTTVTTGVVKLAVYDVLGREVAVLANERMQPGTYTRQWNAGQCPSGIYYCRMTSGAFSAVQRMILQK